MIWRLRRDTAKSQVLRNSKVLTINRGMMITTRTINNKNIANILMFIYTFLFLSNETALSKKNLGFIHWAEFVVMCMLFGLLSYKLLRESKDRKKELIKSNYLVIAYLLVLLIGFAYNGFDYSIARTIFIEASYLLVFSRYFCDSEFIKKYIIRLLIYFNLIFNLAAIIANYALELSKYNPMLLKFIKEYTFIESSVVEPASIFYSNPNSMGIMSALAFILAINLYNKNKGILYKILFAMYLIFTLFNVYFSKCRSAKLALILSIAVFFVIKISKIDAKKIITTCFVGIVILLFSFLAVIQINTNTGLHKFSGFEKKLDIFASGRYMLWKSSYLAQKDRLLIGEGSLKNVIEVRNDFVDKTYPVTFPYRKRSTYNIVTTETKLKETTEKREAGDVLFGVKHVLNNYYLFYPEERRQASSNLNDDGYIRVPTRQISFTMQDFDPHNGYFSLLYCSGLIGMILLVMIMIKKIKKCNALGSGTYGIALVFLLLINFFESAFIIDRFFVGLFIFLLLSLDFNGKVLKNE